MTLLAFTPAQQTAQDEFARWAATAPGNAVHPWFTPLLELIAARRTREAADWLDAFRSEHLGWAQYHSRHAGPVQLIEIHDPVRAAHRVYFPDAPTLTIAVPTAPWGATPGRASAWHPATDTDVALHRGYRVLDEAAPRPNPTEGPARTPDQWCRLLGVAISDPGGWRAPDQRPYTDPIVHAEFRRRLAASTAWKHPAVRIRGRDEHTPAPRP
jgi:hypothetical protein